MSWALKTFEVPLIERNAHSGSQSMELQWEFYPYILQAQTSHIERIHPLMDRRSRLHEQRMYRKLCIASRIHTTCLL